MNSPGGFLDYFSQYNLKPYKKGGFCYEKEGVCFEGPFGQEMREDFHKKTGMRVISWCENGGFRNFMTGGKVIKSPDDLKGMKIRTMEIPASITGFIISESR